MDVCIYVGCIYIYIYTHVHIHIIYIYIYVYIYVDSQQGCAGVSQGRLDSAGRTDGQNVSPRVHRVEMQLMKGRKCVFFRGAK